MEAPIVGGHTVALPLQGQAARREWRKVSDVPNGQGRLVSDGPGNQSRTHQSGRPRSGNAGQRRSSQNGRMFHPGSSEHSSDSDHHGGDGSGGHLAGGPVSPQDMMNQNIGQQDALYDEMHRQQQNEHAAMNTMSMESGMGGMDNPDDALEQQLLEVSRKREQLQQAELELRAQFIARSEMHRMQNSYDEQSKQHSDIVASLQNEIHNRDQRIQHLEQSIEEREQQHRANQMQATEAVWAKDGLLREQTNELASLRRERDAAVAEQNNAIAQFEAEKSDYTAQIEHLKEQVHELERHRQEAEEQNRTSQDLLLFKDGQLQDAQAWMARAQELDAYHINANNTLHAELRDRSEQLNQVWMGYQRQLADMERFHAQVVQRLQTELNEAREQSQLLKGTGAERLGARDERQIYTGNHIDPLQREGNEETAAKASVTTNGGMVRGSPIILSHNMEAAMPLYIPLDNSMKVEQATGLPVVPTPGVVGTNPVLASVGMPVIQQYSLQQQPLTSVSQASPVLQTSFPQLHVHPPVLTTPQHHPSAQQQVHAHLQNPQQQQQQSTQVPHHILSSSSQKHSMQPSQSHQQVLDREEGQQHGGILLSQLSSKAQVPVSSAQSSVQKGEEATVTEPVKPVREGQKVQLLSHSSHDQQQVEHSLKHHRQSNSQPERQRQEQQQHSQSHKQVALQQHDEARQLQHQQGISSSMHHLSQAATSGTEGTQLQQKPPLSKSMAVKQEARQPIVSPVNSQQTTAEPVKNPEPVLLDERALLACLVRAVPAEASAKISLKSTLPNRLGKMLAPLHWQSYRKQYGRLDEFVSSHKELFVIEGDYIYLKEGAHAKVSATTAVAKAAAAAAAASPVGSDRLPTVAVTPVAQVSQVQRGRNAKTSSKDDKARAQVPQDDLSTHKQRSLSPQHTKPGSTRQYASSLSSRNSVGNGIATPNSGGNLDDDNNTTGGEFGSNNLSGNNSGVIENGNANSYGNSRAGGYKGSRQQSSRSSYAGSGQYRKQDNHNRSQIQDSRSTSTPTQ
ncbi:hypothetical protein M758_6G002200 [Ceratodon purpureus]|nr:hypothetical protein M758_6G002200 [Ceratodon purpureus]